MNLKKIISVSMLSMMFLFVAAPAVLAEGETGKEAGPGSIGELITLIENIAAWFQNIVLVIAIIMIMYAGFLWITSGGSEDKIASARKTLLWGLVGIAVVLFAYLAQSFVVSILQ